MLHHPLRRYRRAGKALLIFLLLFTSLYGLASFCVYETTKNLHVSSTQSLNFESLL